MILSLFGFRSFIKVVIENLIRKFIIKGENWFLIIVGLSKNCVC